VSNAIETLGQQIKALGPPQQLSEVVLQTSRYDEMRAWYAAVLGARWHFENTPAGSAADLYPPGEKQVRAADVRASFMRIGGAAPVTIGLFELPWLVPPGHIEPCLNHLQFTENDLDVLVRRVELMRDAGIHPHRTSNHGPVMSFYFRDPDGNIIEFCSRNFATPEEMGAFVRSEQFRNNPSGLELDRDDFLARYHSGMPRAELLKI